MIWIRADANKEIGAGHVMRCLSIAYALRKCGEQICFLVSDNNSVPLIEDRGFDVKILDSDFQQLADEVSSLRMLAGEDRPKLLLIDSYYVTTEYIRQVKQFVPVGYLDDMFRTDLPVDILINYNISAGEEMYEEISTQTKCLLGVKYAPLRDEFSDMEYQVREVATKVLVTTGGSDKYNLAGQILQNALQQDVTSKLHYQVICGAFNIHAQELQKIQQLNPNVFILSNVPNMAELMSQCDIAISAGGSTMYELSTIGVPTLCFSFVDNQDSIVEEFCRKKLVGFAGNYLLQKDDMISKLVESLGGLAKDVKERRRLSKCQRELFDGKGAMRIAQELIAFTKRICA